MLTLRWPVQCCFPKAAARTRTEAPLRSSRRKAASRVSRPRCEKSCGGTSPRCTLSRHRSRSAVEFACSSTTSTGET